MGLVGFAVDRVGC